MNSRVEQILESLTLEQKIGQMVCIGLNTTYVDDEFHDLISKYPFGSIGLFNRNIDNPEQVRLLTRELQNIITPACNGLNAMIALDQEGGVVSQFSSGITHIPGNFAIAAANNEDYAFSCGQITGLELSEMGVTMNWAPVIDLNSNPQNEIIDVRSFGDNVESVCKFSKATVKGLWCGGVGATAKHFPGHGNVIPDLETNLLVNNNSKNHLYENDLMPFMQMSKEQIDAVMVAPVVVPSLEGTKKTPATLSRTMITSVLRNEFGFKGVVMIDDLAHEAIIGKFTLKKAAQITIAAGADMIVLCHSRHHQIIVFNSLLNAVKKGTIKLERIDESVRRIIKMKLDAEEYIKSKASMPVMERNNRVNILCQKSIILYSDKNRLIPIDREKHQRALIILPKLVSLALADSSETLHCNLGEQLMPVFKKTKIINAPMSITKEQASSVIEIAEGYDLVIIATENSNNFPDYLGMINAINSIKPLIIVSLRHPYETGFLPEDATVLLAFSHIDSSMEAIKNVITGKCLSTGILPVSLPG